MILKLMHHWTRTACHFSSVSSLLWNDCCLRLDVWCQEAHAGWKFLVRHGSSCYLTVNTHELHHPCRLGCEVTNTIFEKTNTIFRPRHLSTQLREFGMRVLIGIICHLLREPETIIEWTSASKQYMQSQLRQCFKVRTSQKTGMAVFATCLFTGSKRCNCRNSSNPVPAILLFCRGWEGWGLCDLGWKDIISFTNSFPRVIIAMYRSWESILFFLIWIVKFHRCLCDQ